jgi:hypothetical protein
MLDSAVENSGNNQGVILAAVAGHTTIVVDIVFLSIYPRVSLMRKGNKMLCKYRVSENGAILTNEDFRLVLGFFFNNSPVVVPSIMAAEPNDAMAALLFDMLSEARKRTEHMGWLPGPQGFRPGPAIVAGYLLKIAQSKFLQKHGSVMFLIRVAIAGSFRDPMEDAINGGVGCSE